MLDLVKYGIIFFFLDYGPVEVPGVAQTVAACTANGPRLMITQIVNENFKSYVGIQKLGPFHRVSKTFCFLIFHHLLLIVFFSLGSVYTCSSRCNETLGLLHITSHTSGEAVTETRWLTLSGWLKRVSVQSYIEWLGYYTLVKCQSLLHAYDCTYSGCAVCE